MSEPILTVDTPAATYLVAIPPGSREATYPNGAGYLLVPAPEEDLDDADAEGMLALDGEWLVDCARNGWAGLELLETRPKPEGASPDGEPPPGQGCPPA